MTDEFFGSFREVIRMVQPIAAGLPRIGGALVVMPLFPAAIFQRRLRAAIAIVLVLPMWPMFAAQIELIQFNVLTSIGYVLKEVLIGALIGYVMGVVLWAFNSIGEVIDIQTGFDNARIFDPFSGHPSGPFSSLLTQLGVLMFVAFGGLHVFLQLIYESLLLWPPHQFFPQFGTAWRDLGIYQSGLVLEWTARWATPVVCALLIIELGIGLINRAAPQINAFYFSMPLKAVTALIVLALVCAHLIDAARQDMQPAEQILKTIDRTWRPL